MISRIGPVRTCQIARERGSRLAVPVIRFQQCLSCGARSHALTDITLEAMVGVKFVGN